MRRLIASTTVALLLLAPYQTLADEPTPRRTAVITKKPNHAGLGLAVGLTAGILLGGYAAAEIADEAGAFFVLWTAFAAGGAVGGYALGGGFSSHEWGTIEEQARLREAEEARRVELLSSLSLSPMPELELEPLPLSRYTTTAARLGSWSTVTP